MTATDPFATLERGLTVAEELARNVELAERIDFFEVDNSWR